MRCVAGPSRPLPSFAEGPAAWRLLDHLSLNYASLVDSDAQQGARALRELLALYCPAGDSRRAPRRSKGCVRSTPRRSCGVCLRRGRSSSDAGCRSRCSFDDAAFEGASAFLLGAVLAQFFAQYVSINSFTETVVATLDARSEIMQLASEDRTMRDALTIDARARSATPAASTFSRRCG